MESAPTPLPRALQWLAIALLTFALGLALATPGPGIEISNDESLSTTLVLQKKIADADAGSLDSPDALDALLGSVVERLASSESVSASVLPPADLAAKPPVLLGSAAPRGPPHA